jgi:lipopolysaccharide export system protein LptA
MASLKRICTASLTCGILLLCGSAVAQTAPARGQGAAQSGSDKTDISGDTLERFTNENKTVVHGGKSGQVDAVMANGARLVCDLLTIYSYGPGEGPNAPPPGKPAPAKAAAPSDADVTSADSIKQMVAEGHVFYVTQNETVKGDHGVYDAAPDTITMTGNVVAVQGKNVARGDKMVIDRKTGHTTMVSDVTGRNKPDRVRAVIYGQSQSGQAQTPASGSPAAAKPAKKP